ncbi:DciA family protein [Corynebacterium phoceense]|uniref:DciA family protein n=1 Tax=Corynebacterium TaxID=1716 RepID=UPI0008A20A89|nr:MULTISPECIES: DciA family protein [Corynebacterium]MCQ9336189.1 DciA family protein [Corynebacterium phoceense]OFN43167.1 hypothetical protein HMPREF2559_10480 [Corynebacterium sp. HMSC072G08]
MGDFIQDAVDAARAASKNPPRLNKPVARLRLTEPKPASTLDERAARRAVKHLGRETGADGYAKRRGIGVPQLGDVLRRTVRDQGWEDELGHGWIFGHWDHVVGELNAAHCRPEKIEEKVLTVSCDSSTWATNLRMMQRQILQKIASEIGPDIIAELRITGPKQHRNYQGPQWVKRQGSDDTYG